MPDSTSDLLMLPETRARFSFRMIKYFLTFLALWQDNMVGGSRLQFGTWTGGFGPLKSCEFFLVLLAAAVAMERTLTGNFRIKRNYFSGPLILMFVALFISWMRGSFIHQHIGFIYEAHESFAIPIAFLILMNAFPDKRDRGVLFKIILMATVAKAIEGIDIYFLPADALKEWGVVQMWRDGYLLAIGITSLIIFLHYKGTELARFKRGMLWCTPLLFFTLLMSYRRTFMVAIFVALMLMVITVGKGRRKKQIWLICGFIAVFVFTILSTDPTGILIRLTGIVSPDQDGSAYIRLMEYPNVLKNIVNNPIWGTAIGTEWKVYYRMPRMAIYTTLGTHNTYLYWPLRTGILGTVSFFWLLGRMWKSALINFRLRKSEEDFFWGQLCIQLIILFQVACCFGIMYGDAMPYLLSAILVCFQLSNERNLGNIDYQKLSFTETLRAGKAVAKERHSKWAGLLVPNYVRVGAGQLFERLVRA